MKTNDNDDIRSSTKRYVPNPAMRGIGLALVLATGILVGCGSTTSAAGGTSATQDTAATENTQGPTTTITEASTTTDTHQATTTETPTHDEPVGDRHGSFLPSDVQAAGLEPIGCWMGGGAGRSLLFANQDGAFIDFEGRQRILTIAADAELLADTGTFTAFSDDEIRVELSVVGAPTVHVESATYPAVFTIVDDENEYATFVDDLWCGV